MKSKLFGGDGEQMPGADAGASRPPTPPMRVFIVRKRSPYPVEGSVAGDPMFDTTTVQAHVMQHYEPATVEFSNIVDIPEGRMLSTHRLFFGVEDVEELRDMQLPSDANTH